MRVKPHRWTPADLLNCFRAQTRTDETHQPLPRWSVVGPDPGVESCQGFLSLQLELGKNGIAWDTELVA